jgi:hypothetical protein
MDFGGAAENPAWDPRVTGTVGNSKDKSGREKKPRGKGGSGLGKKKGEQSEDKGKKPGGGLPEKDGHR